MFTAMTAALLLAAAPGQVASRAELAGPHQVASRLQVASQLGLERVEVQFDARGRVSLARGSLGPLGRDPITFVRERSAPLGLGARERLVLLRHERTAEGTQHVRIGRSLAGVPVAFDQIRVHALADGTAYAMEAETSPLDDFVYRPPAFPPGEAVRRAAGGYQGPWAEPPSAALVVVGARLDGVTGAHLAYRLELAYPVKAGELPRREEVYLDARTGEVLGRLSLVMTATPTTFSATNLDGQAVRLNASQDASGIAMLDVTTVAGVTAALLNGANGNALYTSGALGADRAAVSAAEVVAKALAFDKATFGWDKWDFNALPSKAGGTLIAIPHTGTNLNNAYFSVMTSNGAKYGVMSFGDGDGQLFTPLERCLDVAGHEMGHGIITGTANLAYHNQSGALNEHFADVFGWLVEPGDTHIGERCLAARFGGKGLRDMCNPADPNSVISPQPATMAGYKDLPDNDANDNGGVHQNSGIPNRAACLYKQASSFGDLGRVWYQTLTKHLGPTSDFRTMVAATMTSCQELGLGSCAALGSAWTQVGLAPASSGASCPPNATPQGSQCVCNAGYHVNGAQTGCEADAAVTCPAHAHAAGPDCYCDTGYEPDTAGTACVPLNSSGACGAHAHAEGTSCVCDDCYQHASYEATTCTATPGCAVCTDPLSYSDGSGACACIPGTTLAAGRCTPISGQCGLETYTGRCLGDLLIFCADYLNPIRIGVQDCAITGNVCAWDAANSANGFICQPRATDCGSVPDTGVCDGANAKICYNGALLSFDCTGYDCRPFTYGGVAVKLCYPCPAHATWTDAAGGNGTCACDSGYGASADGKSCQAVASCPAHSTPQGTSCACDSGYAPSADLTACVASGGGKGGGCSSTGAAGLLPALALGMLALLRRRRS